MVRRRVIKMGTHLYNTPKGSEAQDKMGTHLYNTPKGSEAQERPPPNTQGGARGRWWVRASKLTRERTKSRAHNDANHEDATQFILTKVRFRK